MVTVMGIEVDDGRLAKWAEWLAPAQQPFLIERGSQLPGEREAMLNAELRDTYELYRLDPSLRLAWLDEAAFGSLTRPERAALVRGQVRHGRGRVPSVRRWSAVLGQQLADQADGHRFVWWRSLLDPHRDTVLAEFVDYGVPPSRHAEVPERVWRSSADVVPRARELAGTFPAASGPNCFGAVMAMCGVVGAEHEWMQREPFEAWLAANARRGGDDDTPGTVFVWRDASGDADHAALCLGGGWAAHKPSQGWMSPTMALPVAEVKRMTRYRGIRLHRYRLGTR